MLLAAPSLCFARALFWRCARRVRCFTYTMSCGQSCLGSGRRTTKGCNLCLDCGFCHVHLDSYAHFHLLGSCPICLIFFFASLKIAESKKKNNTFSSVWESTQPGSYWHVQAVSMCWASLKHKDKILFSYQQCRSFICTVTVPVHVPHSCYVQNSPSHPCRMNAEYVIEICSAGGWFHGAGPRGDSNLTHHGSVHGETESCMRAHIHPKWICFSRSVCKIALLSLLSAFPSCRLSLCLVWHAGACGSVCFLKWVCNVVQSICHRITETRSLPSPGAAWVE